VVADRGEALGLWWWRTEECTRDRTDASYAERVRTAALTLCRDARDADRQVCVGLSLA
jgi:hypothetical protein